MLTIYIMYPDELTRHLILNAGGKGRFSRSFCARRRSEWLSFENGKLRRKIFDYIDNSSDSFIISVIENDMCFHKWLKFKIKGFLLERLCSKSHLPRIRKCAGIILHRVNNVAEFEIFRLAYTNLRSMRTRADERVEEERLSQIIANDGGDLQAVEAAVVAAAEEGQGE